MASVVVASLGLALREGNRQRIALSSRQCKKALKVPAERPDVNPTDEFRNLVALFPEVDALFGSADYIPAAVTPEPYKGLLVHDRHMTVAMEEFHHSPVTVEVLDRKLERNIYSRKILLKRADDGGVVQFAVMRIRLGSGSAGGSRRDFERADAIGTNSNQLQRLSMRGPWRDLSGCRRSRIRPTVRLRLGRGDLCAVGDHLLQSASGGRPPRSRRADSAAFITSCRRLSLG